MLAAWSASEIRSGLVQLWVTFSIITAKPVHYILVVSHYRISCGWFLVGVGVVLVQGITLSLMQYMLQH